MEKKIELLQTIEDHFINKRLDYWLRKKYPDSPFNLICKLIRKGVIRVNGSRATQSIVLSKNDKIKVPKVLIDNKKQNLEQTFSKRFRDKVLKWIIFCNKDFIAINKPSKVSVQGGSKIKISLDSLYQIFKLDYQEKPKLVHRIDKDTSGLLLISRTLEYAQYLTKLFKNRKDIEISWMDKSILEINSIESGLTLDPYVETTSPSLEIKYLLKFHFGETPDCAISFL